MDTKRVALAGIVPATESVQKRRRMNKKKLEPRPHPSHILNKRYWDMVRAKREATTVVGKKPKLASVEALMEAKKPTRSNRGILAATRLSSSAVTSPLLSPANAPIVPFPFMPFPFGGGTSTSLGVLDGINKAALLRLESSLATSKPAPPLPQPSTSRLPGTTPSAAARKPTPSDQDVDRFADSMVQAKLGGEKMRVADRVQNAVQARPLSGSALCQSPCQ